MNFSITIYSNSTIKEIKGKCMKFQQNLGEITFKNDFKFYIFMKTKLFPYMKIMKIWKNYHGILNSSIKSLK